MLFAVLLKPVCDGKESHLWQTVPKKPILRLHKNAEGLLPQNEYEQILAENFEKAGRMIKLEAKCSKMVAFSHSKLAWMQQTACTEP